MKIEFIEKYARVNGSDDDEEMSVVGGDEVTSYSDEKFIDNRESVQDQNPSNYRLMNVSRDLQDALADYLIAKELGLVCSDLKTLSPTTLRKLNANMICLKILKRELKSLKGTLKCLCSTQRTPFYAILDGIYYSMLENKEEFEFCRDEQKLADVIGWKFLISSYPKRNFYC